MTCARLVVLLLLLSAINLTLMVPGGFVEPQNFPSYSKGVLTLFNIFLATLGVGSLVLALHVASTAHMSM